MHTSTGNRIRRITPTEQVYLALSQDFPPCAIQLWIAADTLPSGDALGRALAIAASANMGARLVARGRWWFDSGIAPGIRSIPGSGQATHSHPVFHTPFSFGDVPAVEVVLWEGAGLIFRCSHALMDAGGLVHFAEETFRALRNEPLRGSSAAVSDHEYLQGLAHSPRRKWVSSDAVSPMPARNDKRSGFIWESRSLTGQINAVGARIAAALSKMAHENDAHAESRFMFPVDLRYLDRSIRTTSNFSNAHFQRSAGASDWNEFYCRTLEAFSRHDERAISRWDAWLPWLPAAVLGKTLALAHARQVKVGRYCFSGVVSHVGSVGLAAFRTIDFLPKAVRLLPFDAPASAITLVTIQHDNGLEIAVSCPAMTGADGRLAAALDRICAELEAGKSESPAKPAHVAVSPPLLGERTTLLSGQTVYDLVASQFRACPERVAISVGARTVTYAELDRLTLACAHELHERGVTPEDRVAVYCARSTDTLVALLGIMRLGAAFVPLDPEWPDERIGFVLEDCHPACVISGGPLAFQKDGVPWVFLTELCLSSAGYGDVLPERSVASVAYVLYTSGSTGRPKGVVVGQRSLLNYLIWARQKYLADVDVPIFPFFTSPAFDLTLTSIFLPLITGGQIKVTAQPDMQAAIRSILSDPDINAVKLTPSHLWLFWSSGTGGSALRKYIVGGEALPTRLASEIEAQSEGRAEIFNEYGPTEATIGCVVHRYDKVRDLGVYVPIGLPVANAEVMLLDEHLHPVVAGESGEVFLAGDCLALGYLDRPEEDARFVCHPQRAGERMYRTGDRARLSLMGELEYLGRSDNQVKVRGNRIEIGEIESAIEQSGLCRTFIVIPEETQGGLRLAAFVTWNECGNLEDLRAMLAAKLPGYMMPSRIVPLEQLPLTVNGKVDKDGLLLHPAKGHALATCEGDGIEEILAEIVASLPDRPIRDVPFDRSLLELGFDSLQMMLLLSLTQRRFLNELAYGDFISGLGGFVSDPTLRKLAAQLRTMGVSLNGGAK